MKVVPQAAEATPEARAPNSPGPVRPTALPDSCYDACCLGSQTKHPLSNEDIRSLPSMTRSPP